MQISLRRRRRIVPTRRVKFSNYVFHQSSLSGRSLTEGKKLHFARCWRPRDLLLVLLRARVSSFVFSYCLGSRSWRAGITRVPVILFSDKIWRSYRSWNRGRISGRATSLQFGVVRTHWSFCPDLSLAIIFISRIRENCTLWIGTQTRVHTKLHMRVFFCFCVRTVVGWPTQTILDLCKYWQRASNSPHKSGLWIVGHKGKIQYLVIYALSPSTWGW